MNIVGKSDTGLVRKTNQDAYAFSTLAENACFAVVCDGMGGANSGDVAAKTAVEIISKRITENYKKNMSVNSIKTMLTTAITNANIKIYNMAQENKDLMGMGTTVVAVVVVNSTAFVVHVGDSRAYLINSLCAFQLTRDHSMVQQLVEQGKLTEKQAKSHPEKNIITRALGVEKKVNIDYLETRISEKDIIVICTDGLTNYVDGNEIKKICMKMSPEKALDAMIEKAIEKGGTDNITSVILS